MAEINLEEYQALTRCEKVKKVLPKVLSILILSVILPTADVVTDFALITKLYTGLALCVESDGIKKDEEEYLTCGSVGAVQYCSPGRVSNNTVCGVSQYYCRQEVKESGRLYIREYEKCEDELGPDQYCTLERVSNIKNTVCGLKKSSNYFCRDYKIWSSEWNNYKQCRAQGVNKYCSDSASSHNACAGPIPHPKLATSLLFFFLLNYVMGLLTCVRLDGRKRVPLIAALFIVYPQYCK